jgi:two-component system, response regulator
MNNLILVVEDNDDDYLIFERAFKKSRCSNPIRRLSSGEAALDYLFHKGEFSKPHSALLPAVILLDLNMPGTDGRSVLHEIKNSQRLKKIPVIVLTTSEDPRDINSCYEDGANGFIVKPASFEGFIEAIKTLKGYWFDISVLPIVAEGLEE